MIRKKKGVHIGSEEKIVADGNPSDQAMNFVSHAHADHALKSETSDVICSDITRKLVEERFGTSVDSTSSDRIKLIDSGHVIGSSAALIDNEVLYTGDVSMQDRLYIEGFEPVKAEKLVVEATYGIPSYRLPDQKEVVKEVKDWIKDNNDQTLLLFGYSLGKAQKIQRIVQEATDRDILAHGSVKNMNSAVKEVSDLELRSKPYGKNKDLLEDNSILIAPSRSSQADWVEKLVKKHDAIKAGFSGWAVNDSFKYRGGYDKTFALSDHCGFQGLVRLVEDVDPEKVYTHHGFDEALASYLKKEKGFNARALKNNQSSLERFS